MAVGGWGYLFGDEGSAFAIARDALAFAMSEDDRGLASPLGDAALAYFDRPDLRALATAALLGRLPRNELASFARVVLDAARLGDPVASRIVDDAASARRAGDGDDRAAARQRPADPGCLRRRRVSQRGVHDAHA